MLINRKNKVIAIGATLALALTGFVGLQSANAVSGKNCTLKSVAKTADCDSVTYAALQRVGSLDAVTPVGGYTESQMAYIVQGQLYRFNADGFPAADLIYRLGKNNRMTLKSSFP